MTKAKNDREPYELGEWDDVPSAESYGIEEPHLSRGKRTPRLGRSASCWRTQRREHPQGSARGRYQRAPVRLWQDPAKCTA